MRSVTPPPQCTAFHRLKSAAWSGILGCGPAVVASALTGGPPPGAGGFVLLGETLCLTQERSSCAPAAEPRCSDGCRWCYGSKCWLGNSHRSETSPLTELPATLNMAFGHGGLVHGRSGWTLLTQPPPEGAGSPCGPPSGLTGPPHGDIPPLSSLPASCTAGSSTHLFHSL